MAPPDILRAERALAAAREAGDSWGTRYNEKALRLTRRYAWLLRDVPAGADD